MRLAPKERDRLMAAFPLYDELALAAKKSARAFDIHGLAQTLSGLPEEHAAMVFVLIHHHHNIENRGVGFHSIAYGGKAFSGGRGVLFPQLTDLPPVLIHILAAYVDYAARGSATATV